VTLERWLKHDDMRQWIDEEAKRYLTKLPDAINASHRVIDAAKDIDPKDPNTKHLMLMALDEAKQMRQAVGIAVTHTPSVVIGQLVLGDQTNVLAPNVQSLLDHQLGDILDVTPCIDDGQVVDNID
jgi:hypothetical protein